MVFLFSTFTFFTYLRLWFFTRPFVNLFVLVFSKQILHTFFFDIVCSMRPFFKLFGLGFSTRPFFQMLRLGFSTRPFFNVLGLLLRNLLLGHQDLQPQHSLVPFPGS